MDTAGAFLPQIFSQTTFPISRLLEKLAKRTIFEACRVIHQIQHRDLGSETLVPDLQRFGQIEVDWSVDPDPTGLNLAHQGDPGKGL